MLYINNSFINNVLWTFHIYDYKVDGYFLSILIVVKNIDNNYFANSIISVEKNLVLNFIFIIYITIIIISELKKNYFSVIFLIKIDNNTLHIYYKKISHKSLKCIFSSLFILLVLLT